MTARVQVIVEAKDEASGILRGITSQFGAFGSVIEEMTGKSINWGNVFAQAAQLISDGAKKSLEATSAYAKEVRDLSLASGQSAEESSRLIQVLDDYEISAQDVTAATRAMTKEGLAPTVETLAQLSDQYLSLNTAQERNAFIIENLGRGGMQWANVLKEGGDAIRQMSSEIDGSLILTDDAIKQAEEYRLALDAWNDSVQALQISIGTALMPALTAMINDLTGHNRVREEANRLISEGTARNREDALQMATENIAAMDAYTVRWEGLVTLYEDATPAILEAADATKTMTETNREALGLLESYQGAIESYEDKNTKLTEERMKLEEEKAKLISQGYSEQSAKIQELNGKMEENKKKSQEVATQFELDNKKIMLGYLERKLMADGTLTDDELNWLLEKGQAWGVYSEEAVTAMQTAMSTADELFESYKRFDGLSYQAIINTMYTTTGTPPNVPIPVVDSTSASQCFIGGTKITMWDYSLVNIENVKVGDVVLSYDEKNKEFVTRKVEQTFKHEAQGYLIINGLLGVTPNHQMYVNGAWKDAGEIVKGDVLFLDDDTSEIVETIEEVEETAFVFNLHTEDDPHNYFADGYLVHNKQMGGEVYAGKMVNVGEAGAESFVPSQNGRILGHAESLHAAGLSGGANYFYGNVTLQIDGETAGGLLEYR